MKRFAESIAYQQSNNSIIFFLGQAGFVIKSPCGTLLGIDLYLSDCVERYDGFKRLCPHLLEPSEIEFDYLVSTHAHYDHFDVDAMPLLLANGRTHLYASPRCKIEAERLHLREGQISYVNVGDSVRIDDIGLHFVFCDHGQSAPDAFGVVIDVAGKKLFVAGDTCLRLDKVDEILKHGPFDVMMAPINGAFGNLDEKACIELCKRIKPRLVVPCHYWMFAEQHGDPGLFKATIEKELPKQSFLLMRPGEELKLND